MLRPSLLQVVRQVEDLQIVGAADPVETKSKNPKPGSKAAPPPQRRLCSLSLSARLSGPVLAVKGSASPRSAPWTAPGRAWGLAVYEGKGGTANGGGSTGNCLHKRAITQQPSERRVFKDLGIAKRYCRRDSMGNSFVQRPGGLHLWRI